MRDFYAERNITPLGAAKGTIHTLLKTLEGKTDNVHMVLAMANLHAQIAIADELAQMCKVLAKRNEHEVYEEEDKIFAEIEREIRTYKEKMGTDAQFLYKRNEE